MVETNSGTDSGGSAARWVTAAEAAELAGVSADAVLVWADAGNILSQRAYGLSGAQVMVRLDEVLAAGRPAENEGEATEAAVGGTSNVPAADLAPILKAVPELMEQLTKTTDRAARAETKLEFLSTQVAALREELESVLSGGGPAISGVPPLPPDFGFPTEIEWPSIDEELGTATPEEAAPQVPAPDEPAPDQPAPAEPAPAVEPAAQETAPIEPTVATEQPHEPAAEAQPLPFEAPADPQTPEELFRHFLSRVAETDAATAGPQPEERFRRGFERAMSRHGVGAEALAESVWGDENPEAQRPSPPSETPTEFDLPAKPSGQMRKKRWWQRW